MIKKIIGCFLIFLFVVVGIIIYGLQLLEIEDRYGDLQKLYWNSKDGDIIFNKLNSRLGIIELGKNRIYIRENTRLIDLEEWLDPNDSRRFQAVIYRLNNSTDRQRSLTDIDLKSECKFITEVNVQY